MLKNGTPRLLATIGFCALGLAGAKIAGAQQTAVGREVQNGGANAGTIAAGDAIQRLCGAMSQAGYTPTLVGAPETPAGASAAAQNLYLRCNEIVQTATNGARTLGVSATGLAHVVQQISGEEVSSQGALAVRVPSGQFTNIGARLNALRLGSLGAQSHLLADNDWDSPGATPAQFDAFHHAFDDWNGMKASSQGNASGFVPAKFNPDSFAADDVGGASPDKASAYKATTSSPFGWSTEGSYGWGHRDETSNEDAFRFHSFSVTVGADYNFGNTVLGASVGFDRYNSDFNVLGSAPQVSSAVAGGDSKIDGYSGSLFGAWFGDHLSVDGILSYGVLRSDVTRVVDYANNNGTCFNCGVGSPVALTGSPDGHFIATGVTVGYALTVASINVSPSVSANYRRAVLDRYTENDPTSSGLALAYDSQTIESMRSIVGLNLSRSFSPSFGVLTPSFKAEWHHEFKDDARSVQMQYATVIAGVSGNFGFAVPTDKPESNFGIVGFGLTSLFPHRLQSYVYYERLVGVPYLKSNALSVGLRGQF